MIENYPVTMHTKNWNYDIKRTGAPNWPMYLIIFTKILRPGETERESPKQIVVGNLSKNDLITLIAEIAAKIRQ